MNCREVVQFLDDYYEGCLPSETRAVFEKHLHDCACCEEFLRQYRLVIRAAAACKETPCAPLPERLLAAILAAAKPNGEPKH